ncbi:serine/threonine-protein kinase, partial [Nocardia gipuzkoensis]
MAQFLRITTQPIPDLRELDFPADIAEAIESAMSPEPEDRPGSAYELGELLRAVQQAHGQIPDEMALLDAGIDAEDTGNGTGVAAPVSNPSLRTRSSMMSGPRATLSLRPQTEAVPSPSTLPPTPTTKFRPPTPAREPVPRPRLLEVLRAGGRRRLAVIHGPAGFGKSTVAAQWRNELTDRAVAV